MNEMLPPRGTGDRPSPSLNAAGAGLAPALPHNLDAEQALLGAILLNNDVFEQIAELVDDSHFFEPLHRRIFERASDLIRKGRLASPITLKSVLGDDQGLAEVGGQAYLAALAGAAIAVASPRDYAQVVRDLALRRDLIRISDAMRSLAFDGAADLTPHQQIERAEADLYDLAERGHVERGFEPFRVALKKATEMAASAYQNSSGIAGISTGFIDLDKKLGGLFPSDLIILAGRPGMGKTALATNIAFNVARNYRVERDLTGEDRVIEGGIVAFFSLEMSEEQLALRILSEQTEIRSEFIRKGQISEDDFRKLAAVAAELENIPLYIDSTGAIPISMLATRARRLKRKHGLNLIVIDYLQLMTPGNRKRFDSRVQEVSEITQGLKALAKELDVPILALSQLSRAVEQRENKRPILADLRESGSIEQDADIVLFVYRDEYYLKHQEPPRESAEWDDWRRKSEPAHRVAEILVEKHRHGPTGSVQLQFASEFTRFSNLERGSYDVR